MRNKFVTITLVFAMIASAIPSNAIQAAKKVKLNRTKLVLQVGKTYKLKLKNYKKKVKWSSSKKTVATVSKKGKVKAKKAGTAKVTAKAGKKKYICKVQVQKKRRIDRTCTDWPTPPPTSTPPAVTPTPPTVTPSAIPTPDAPKLTLIYDYSPETPDVYNYNDFKFNSFRIWLCPFTFYGEGYYESKDYRGKKLHYELTIKNSGVRDLPVLDVCFNYTYPTVYPTAYRVYDPVWGSDEIQELEPPEKPNPADYPMIAEDEDGEEYEMTYEEALEYYEEDLEYYNSAKEVFNSGLAQPITKGKTYTYSFDFTIPEDAYNGDYDIDAETHYPIMMYISNLKSACPYKVGDEITILGCKIYEIE